MNLICHECGGELRRSRRKLSERFRYLEAYRCKECKKRARVSVGSRIRDSRYTKCPGCRSYDLTNLRRVDKIDKMRRGFINLLHRLLGGQLYHCWFCRLQFYDVRPQRAHETPSSVVSATPSQN